MEDRKKYGLFSMICGVILGIFCLITIDNDMEYKGLFSGQPTYTYEPPYTDHETTMIVLCIVAVIAICIGLYLWFSNREENNT